MVAVIAVSILTAIGGLALVRRTVSQQALKMHHEVAGYLLSVVGTLYSVVLGLVVVGALSTFQQARMTVAQEANSLYDIFHLANGLPVGQANKVREFCSDYARTLIVEEWPAMNNGKASEHARLLTSELWNAITTYEPKTQNETDLHSSMLSELNTLEDNRQIRLSVASPVYDIIVWTVLLGGGACIVIFTYFFGVNRFAVQVLMTSMVTFILSLNMTVVAMFGYPYSGDVHVLPTPFQSDLKIFETEMAKIKDAAHQVAPEPPAASNTQAPPVDSK